MCQTTEFTILKILFTYTLDNADLNEYAKSSHKITHSKHITQSLICARQQNHICSRIRTLINTQTCHLTEHYMSLTMISHSTQNLLM